MKLEGERKEQAKRNISRANEAKWISRKDSGDAIVKAFKFYKKALLICKKAQ
jgi:hypothetical protein